MTDTNALESPRALHLVLDDFLSREAVEAMLAQMLAAEPHFTASQIGSGEMGRVDSSFRSSQWLPGRVGVDLTPLTDAIGVRVEELCAAAGVAPFPVSHRELSIVSHRDGDFYKRHIDTRTGVSDDGSVRVVSCVYYLHRAPRGFSGGALAIHSIIGDGEPVVVEPLHNRLVVFPSFIPHEVLPTRSSGGFADSRFSVNCWLRRAKSPGPARGDCV